jgi:hypothetical protein
VTLADCGSPVLVLFPQVTLTDCGYAVLVLLPQVTLTDWETKRDSHNRLKSHEGGKPKQDSHNRLKSPEGGEPKQDRIVAILFWLSSFR